MRQLSYSPISRRVMLLFGGVLVVGLVGSRLLALDNLQSRPVYVANPRDCVCGLNKLRQLTNPARLDYPQVLAATPYMKELERKRIDPDSARGVMLRSRAEALVYRVCTQVRKERDYCSIWKAIRRRDGRPIPDVTREVRRRVENVLPEGEPMS